MRVARPSPRSAGSAVDSWNCLLHQFSDTRWIHGTVCIISFLIFWPNFQEGEIFITLMSMKVLFYMRIASHQIFDINVGYSRAEGQRGYPWFVSNRTARLVELPERTNNYYEESSCAPDCPRP